MVQYVVHSFISFLRIEISQSVVHWGYIRLKRKTMRDAMLDVIFFFLTELSLGVIFRQNLTKK